MTKHDIAGLRGQYAYAEGAQLVVEWYSFGDDQPYEFASLLVLDADTQAALARSMGLRGKPGPRRLAAMVARTFPSWFAFRDHLAANEIAATRKTDFWP